MFAALARGGWGDGGTGNGGEAAARNGDETFNSLKFGSGMAKLLNAPAPQPTAPLDGALAKATKALAASRAVVAKGVVGKWAARRAAEVAQFEHEVELLQALAS